MIYIENEGALFRGPARGIPQEVWSARQGKFIPYPAAGKPKDIDWGNVIDEAEAQKLMGGAQGDPKQPEQAAQPEQA